MSHKTILIGAGIALILAGVIYYAFSDEIKMKALEAAGIPHVDVSKKGQPKT